MTNPFPRTSTVASGWRPPALPASALRPAPRSALWRSALLYLAAAALSLGAVVWVMHLWQADLRVPFDYEHDAMLNITIVKIMLEKGWYLHTGALGAPTGLRLEEFPVGDNLVCAMMKVMSIFTSDPVLITNLFFLATFPLVALSALHTVRRFGVSAGPALLVSLLYTWQPYHFWRGTAQLYLSAYFLVPPAILVAWWISTGRLVGHRGRVWFSFGVAALLGCNCVYYPFFACFLLLVAVVLALWRRDQAHAAIGGAWIAAVVLSGVLNLLPCILYARAHGTAIQRQPAEAENKGLRITELLLPSTGHRLPALARYKAGYDRTHSFSEYGTTVGLGFIAGSGFLGLLGWAVFVRRARPAEPTSGFYTLLDHLGVYNLAGLLLATVSGFSSLFALLVTPQIRAYNRFCIFIAFFSLLAIAVGLDVVARRWVKSTPARAGFAAALSVLGLLGLLDQAGANASHDWTELQRSFHNDQQFFGQVQHALPTGSLVFELPYMPFPEYGDIHLMFDYAGFRPYVHTHGFRWSYGVTKNRPGDAWDRETAALAPAAMVETLRRAGFSALYIDRFGYEDHGVELEARLRALLAAAPLSDRGERFLLFKLAGRTGPAPHLDAIPPPPTPHWTGGFYDLETPPDKAANWRWCSADGELRFVNGADEVRRVRVHATLRSGAPGTLQIRGGSLIQEDLPIDPAGTAFSRVLELPPGASAVRFHCDADPLPKHEGDARTLVWRVDDFGLDRAD